MPRYADLLERYSSAALKSMASARGMSGAKMGKLDAIFGKRARNIAGEFTAEATQGPQQLKTTWKRPKSRPNVT